MCSSFFFFNDPATTEIYTLSLHDALPIWRRTLASCRRLNAAPSKLTDPLSRASVRRSTSATRSGDRKSTRLNSSHVAISYAVFCLKKKKKKNKTTQQKNQLTTLHTTQLFQ